MDHSRAVGLPSGVSYVVIRGVVVATTPYHNECISRGEYKACEKKNPPQFTDVNEGDFCERNEVIVRQMRSEIISLSQRNVSP